MSSEAEHAYKATSEHPDNICIVCCKFISIYAVGECDHFCCYECSSRIRVLCSQKNDCPICRRDLAKVIFTKTVASFQQLDIKNRSGLYDKRYRIVFADSDVQHAFFDLLDNRCPKCRGKVFHRFEQLKEHVRKEHELFYCDICTEHLKLFSFERRLYNRQDLATHRRKGDPDKIGHRGHPLCEYCDTRYLDKDELFRHLRREHYFCHFCDAEGSNHFYGDYDTLREHFRAEHYLCEEGECLNEQFTAVFRTDIDLRAHRATMHGKTMPKYATKQARTLELEFSYTPRVENNTSTRRNNRIVEMNENEPIALQPITQNKAKQIEVQNEHEFPSLGGGSVVQVKPQNVSIQRVKVYGSAGLVRTKENFPALGNVNQEAATFSSNNLGNRLLSTSAALLKNNKPSSSNHNSMSSKPNSSMMIHVSNRPSSSKVVTNDFPALPGSITNGKDRKDLFMDMKEAAPDINITNAVPKQYRTLLNEYTPVSNTISAKIVLTPKDEPSKNTLPANAPKLDSMNVFPSLLSQGNGNSQTTSAPQWVSSKSRPKTKVGPSNIKEEKYNSQMTKYENVEKDKINKKNMDTKLSNEKINDRSHKKDSKIKGNDSNKNNAPTISGDSSKNSNYEGKRQGISNVITLHSVSRNSNNLTFTNSNGESYNILPSQHKYTPPVNAKHRNQSLITNFQRTLKSSEALNEFRQISQMFRDGTYYASGYYEHCKAALGDKFDDIFPELLAMLPDIVKQQELYLVFSQDNTCKDHGRKHKRLDVCSTCKQVLIKDDVQQHVQSHFLENNFPALNK